MAAWWQKTLDWSTTFVGEGNVWAVKLLLIILGTFIVAFLISRIISKLEKKALATKNLWDDALCESLRKPLILLVWIVGLTYALSSASSALDFLLSDFLQSFRHISAIFVAVWFINGFIQKVEDNIVDPQYMQKPMDKTTAIAVGKLLRITVIFIASLVALQSLDYSISGVLAFGGVGGIAVGFAAKDLLANFFGGLMIYLDRPFTVGDWVRSPDQNIEGTVEDIGWRLTRIRTFDKRPLYVPNSTFTHISVENPSRMLNRRIYETIGVRYDDANKMADIVRGVKTMLEEHNEIDHNQIIMVNFTTFAASSLDFFIYCFTKTTDWAYFHEVKQDVLLKVLTVIDECGAECAFPTSTLHVPDGVKITNETP